MKSKENKYENYFSLSYKIWRMEFINILISLYITWLHKYKNNMMILFTFSRRKTIIEVQVCDFYSFSILFLIDSEIKISLKMNPLEPCFDSFFLKSTLLLQLLHLCSNHILMMFIIQFYDSFLSIFLNQDD